MKRIPLLAAALICASSAAAQGDTPAAQAAAPVWRLALSPHTEHYGRSEDHRSVWLVGLERESADGSLMGAGHFRNSFGQPSWYAYPWGGVYRNLLGFEGLFFKWSAGVVYGYRPPFEDKVPINIGGFTPVVVPGLGVDLGRGFSAQVNAIGTAAVMFQLSYDLQHGRSGR